jgi:predicted nuclease with TOPRIM domain
MSGNEDDFQRLKAALDRARDQILSGIPETKLCLELTQIPAGLKAIQGEPELQHELLQMQIQLDEVRKENVIIKRSNTQLAVNLEDAETRLAEIQLNL